MVYGWQILAPTTGKGTLIMDTVQLDISHMSEVELEGGVIVVKGYFYNPNPFKDKVEGILIRDVKTNKEKEIPCQGVFVFVGNLPNSKFAISSRLGSGFFRKVYIEEFENENFNVFYNLPEYTNGVKYFELDEDNITLVQSIAEEFASESSPKMQIDMTELLKFFSLEAPDLITNLISIITGKSTTEVDDQYSGESVLAFAIPYVIHSMKKSYLTPV